MVASRCAKVVAVPVGQIVGRHVHGLNEVIEPFLVEVMRSWSAAHFRGEGRLVTDRAGGTAEQGRTLRNGLREPEDVVNEHSTS